VLSVFPGIGLLDMAFEEAGFCVVRGPDVLWGGDIKQFHPPRRKFDGVIGGPPCQLFSILKRLNPLAGEKHGNLIPEFERVVDEATPHWFLMENVEGAPIPGVSGYTVRPYLVRDVWVGGQTSRLRRFSFGSLVGMPLEIELQALFAYPEPAALAGGSGREQPVRLGGSGRPKRTTKDGRVVSSGPNPGARALLSEMCRKQGLSANFLEEAPFTEGGKKKMVGNGVPLPMGRAVALAIKRAMYPEMFEATA
jgi:DNA (cytosine-5)-methyltransferase 1